MPLIARFFVQSPIGMARVTVFCFFASYLVAFLLELTRLWGRSAVSRILMLGFAGAGLLAHSIYLVVRSRQFGLPPLLGSAHDWMLVLAWLLVAAYLVLTARNPELALGTFLLPVVLVLIVAADFMSRTRSELIGAEARGARGLVMLHASALVLGMVAVLGGGVAALMYLFQHWRLKTRSAAQTGFRMPSLELLARANRWSVMAAFPLLTLGLLTGIALAFESVTVRQSFRLFDPTVVVSSLLWLVLAVTFVWMLRHERPSGKQIAWLTLCSCGFLIVTLLALKVVTGTHLLPVQTWHAGIAPRGSLPVASRTIIKARHDAPSHPRFAEVGP